MSQNALAKERTAGAQITALPGIQQAAVPGSTAGILFNVFYACRACLIRPYSDLDVAKCTDRPGQPSGAQLCAWQHFRPLPPAHTKH